MFENVRRIFFDSGMVLVYPRSGDWFYPGAHKEYCEKHGLPEKSFSQNLNFPKAYARLAKVGKIESEDALRDPQTKGIVMFNEKVRNDQRVEKIILPLRDGLMIIRKK